MSASSNYQTWKNLLGESFHLFEPYLAKTTEKQPHWECPYNCYREVREHNGIIMAICSNAEEMCDEVQLELEEILLWRLKTKQLGNDIISAFTSNKVIPSYRVMQGIDYACQIGYYLKSKPIPLVLVTRPNAINQEQLSTWLRELKGFILFTLTPANNLLSLTASWTSFIAVFHLTPYLEQHKDGGLLINRKGFKQFIELAQSVHLWEPSFLSDDKLKSLKVGEKERQRKSEQGRKGVQAKREAQAKYQDLLEKAHALAREKPNWYTRSSLAKTVLEQNLQYKIKSKYFADKYIAKDERITKLLKTRGRSRSNTH